MSLIAPLRPFDLVQLQFAKNST